MAIYRCEVKTISRSKGRSATAAIAYRAGESIRDDRTGQIFNYTKKRGVEHRELIFPSDVKVKTRQELWNQAEQAETRKNSTVAREYELALPAELSPEIRKNLALVFAKIITNRYGVAADVAIHQPHPKGDQRNHHAHILTTTRQFNNDGLGAKTRILDDLKTGPQEVESLRHIWAVLINDELEKAGISERVDHRSLAEQGIDRTPTLHLGPAATYLERRGIETDVGNHNRKIQNLNSTLKTPDEDLTARARTWAQKKINEAIADRRREFEILVRQEQESNIQKLQTIQEGLHYV